MKKIIKNVGLLDIRNATEESISEIEKILNVGAVIYSSKTAHLLTRLSFGNLGASIEVPDDCKIITGQVEINKGYLEQQKEPLDLFLTGQIIFKNDLEPEDIEKGFKSLLITGQLLCPEKIMPAVQSKIKSITGQVYTYPANAIMHQGKIIMNKQFLNSLDDGTFLFIIGKIEITDEIDAELLDRKIKSISLIGKAIVKEEYSSITGKKLLSGTASKIEVIPAGFTYIGKELTLNRLNLSRFSQTGIYCPSGIRISDDIKSEELKKHIKGLISKTGIICHEDRSEVVFSLCPDPLTRILSYKNRLAEINQEHLLTQEELEFSKEGTSYIVTGELEIDSGIDPELLSSGIDCIDNFGEIMASKKHYGIIQSKLRTNEGEIIISDSEKGQEDENTISNAGYLKL